MITSTVTTGKAMLLIAKEFQIEGASILIRCKDSSIIAEVNQITYEICTGSLADLEKPRSGLVRKVYKWIRENIHRVHSIHATEEQPEAHQEQPACNCLEKIGTIYKNRELRDLQQRFLKYSSSYGIYLLDLHHSSDKLYRDELDLAKKKANSWAHPDKGGDSEMFDMITRSYEDIDRIIKRKGYL